MPSPLGSDERVVTAGVRRAATGLLEEIALTCQLAQAPHWERRHLCRQKCVAQAQAEMLAGTHGPRTGRNAGVPAGGHYQACAPRLSWRLGRKPWN